jgi:hypothetical protein
VITQKCGHLSWLTRLHISLEDSSLFDRCEMAEILQSSAFNLNSYCGDLLEEKQKLAFGVKVNAKNAFT